MLTLLLKLLLIGKNKDQHLTRAATKTFPSVFVVYDQAVICPAVVARHVHEYLVLYRCIPRVYSFYDLASGCGGGSVLLLNGKLKLVTSWRGAPGLSALLDFYLAPRNRMVT